MYKNILVPIAPSHGDAQRSIDVARKLLDDGGQITLLTVQEVIPNYAEAYLPVTVLEDSKAQLINDLKDLAEGQDDINIGVIIGNAGSSIVEFATQSACDCIVVLSHQPGVADYFLGSTAARVVRHAKCCVHVIR